MRPVLVRTLLFLALPAHALVAQGPTAQGAATALPVRSVVLFSSGVGYFEHAGTVRGDATAELRFKTTQINDVLKSLTLQDQDGGRVTTITYPSQDPISKTLRSFQVDITTNPGMASLLNQLRGAKVSLQAGAERLSGTVMGVENRVRASEKGDAIQLAALNLLTGATIRTVELQAITALTLDDPVLQDELTKALVALSQARDQDKKPVTISFMGTGERRVRMGYVVETPIWKTSYRLMLDDKTARLQGWAIVENQTESDWSNIALSLVSGRPISFIMNLYTPMYLQRPTVVPDFFTGLQPQRYDESATTPAGAPVPGGGGRGGMVARDQAASRQMLSGEMSDRLPVDRLNPAGPVQGGIATNAFEDASISTGASSVRSVAAAAQLGELFQYTISNVTLARQKSAMLPIITDTVAIDRLSIYNAGVLPRNPLNGVRLHNTTGKHLQQGPITVLDRGGYAGDAQIDNVPPGHERLLSYGVDLDVLVDNTKNSQSSAVTTAKIVKGVLQVERKFVSQQEYAIDNKGSRAKVVLVEHPVRSGFTLTDSPKPVEVTPTVYRFETTVAAGKATVLTVKEENIRQQGLMMLPATLSDLLMYSRTGEIPTAVREAIGRAIAMKQAVQALESQIADRNGQVAAITAEQERIRENMKTVDAKSPYYERLLSKLNVQESSIERLQSERDELQGKRDAQQRALEEYLTALTVG